MIAVNFYTFAKRKNSTKLPTGSPTTYNCVLKDGCSMIAPVIGLDIGLTANPHQYNYVHISAFGRYYYVSDWAWEDRLWWATLAVDVLATYRTQIDNTTEYVVRTSVGNYVDGSIPDTMYPAKSVLQNNLSFLDNSSSTVLWEVNYNNGCYVVGIINNDKYSMGAVSYYLLLPNGFKELKDLLLSDTDWTEIATTNPDLGDNLYRSLFNPYQYFTTINWFPFIPTLGHLENVTSINVGWWPVTFTASNVAFRIPANGFTYEPKNGVNAHTIRLYNHPQSGRGEFLNASPYTRYSFIIPPWGTFEIDGQLLAGMRWSATGSDNWPQYQLTLDINIIVDLISGMGTLYITGPIQSPVAGSGIMVYTSTALVAVPIQLAQIAMSDVSAAATRQAVNTAVPWVQDILTGLGIDFNIGNVAGIGNGLLAGAPIVQTGGGNGSIAPYFLNIVAIQTYSIMADDALFDKGQPCCKYLRLGDCALGYVQTSGSHIDIAGYETEIEQINQALDGGVYLE